MKKNFFSAAPLLLLFVSSHTSAQNVGIGTSSPNIAGLLHVQLNSSTSKGLLVTGNYSTSGTVPDLGAGSRLMFFPAKAAFRAGYVDVGSSATFWNDANVGFFSAATGYNTLASGQFSTATGSGNTASGYASFAGGEGCSAANNYGLAIGYHTNAGGVAASALGNSTSATSLAATAMGGFTVAGSNYATAMGYHTTATGEQATAAGFYTTASGFASVAMGLDAVASGDGSFALGHNINTNNNFGAFLLGDSDPNGEGVTFSGYSNEFVARFWNGYYFMTSGNASRFGVTIGHNGNAWVSICDKNRKENFEPLDGEEVLRKISAVHFSSWNYKQQDPKLYRHYGIMAQDFYQAFGKDAYGTIGNDTTVNPIDMIGIDMTAIQALEKRTSALAKANAELQASNNALANKLAALQSQLDAQQKLMAQLLATTNKNSTAAK